MKLILEIDFKYLSDLDVLLKFAKTIDKNAKFTSLKNNQSFEK